MFVYKVTNSQRSSRSRFPPRRSPRRKRRRPSFRVWHLRTSSRSMTPLLSSMKCIGSLPHLRPVSRSGMNCSYSAAFKPRLEEHLESLPTSSGAASGTTFVSLCDGTGGCFVSLSPRTAGPVEDYSGMYYTPAFTTIYLFTLLAADLILIILQLRIF